MARVVITAYSRSRSSGRRSFESSTPRTTAPGSRITAAATTGPARGPRPASSTPATRLMPLRHAARSKRYGATVTVLLLALLACARYLGQALLLQACGLAGQLAQVVQLRPTHHRPLQQLDPLDAGRMQRERALDPHAVRDAPHRERGPGAAPALAD